MKSRVRDSVVKVKDSQGLVFKYLIWMAALISISMSPWTNMDSLIIPKLAILFATSLSLIPFILSYRNFILQTIIGKLLILISVLIILQLLLVVWFTPAPFEQQFYGRTGRGLGFATELAIILILLSSTLSFRLEAKGTLQVGLIASCYFTSLYSIGQRLGFDLFDWVTRTNGIVGTLGNPNFQSSFAAMALIPTATYFWWRKNGKFLTILAILPLVILIYLSESTQGYLISLVVIGIYMLLYFWYSRKRLFYVFVTIFLLLQSIVLLGIFNKGPFASIIYKISIQSREDFYRVSIAIANDHPLFGVGLDSLGDNYLKYWNPDITSSIGEFADNSHNSFLQYASTGGYPLAILQYLIPFLVIYSFFKIQKFYGKFNSFYTALFSAWIAFQLQALISPSNIAMLMWNAVISGALLGSALMITKQDMIHSKDIRLNFIKPLMYFLFIAGLVIIYPLYKVDNLYVVANKTGDGDLAIESALSFPESSIRYARIGRVLLESNLLPQALELGRAAVKFNPNAPSAWALILLNNSAPLEERVKAKQEVLRLDPFNMEIRGIQFPPELDPGN